MRILKEIVLLKIDSRKIMARLVFDCIGHQSGGIITEVAREQKVHVDCVKIVGTINVEKWQCGNEVRRRFLRLSLEPLLSSHVGAEDSFNDLLSQVASTAHFRGEVVGHNEALAEH